MTKTSTAYLQAARSLHLAARDLTRAEATLGVAVSDKSDVDDASKRVREGEQRLYLAALAFATAPRDLSRPRTYKLLAPTTDWMSMSLLSTPPKVKISKGKGKAKPSRGQRVSIDVETRDGVQIIPIQWIGGNAKLPLDVGEAIQVGGPSELYSVTFHPDEVQTSGGMMGTRCETHLNPAHARVNYYGSYTRVPTHVGQEILARMA